MLNKKIQFLLLLIILITSSSCVSEAIPYDEACYVNYVDEEGTNKREHMNETQLEEWMETQELFGYNTSIFNSAQYVYNISITSCKYDKELYIKMTKNINTKEVIDTQHFNVDVKEYFSSKYHLGYITNDHRILIAFFNIDYQKIKHPIIEYTDLIPLKESEHIIDIAFDNDFIFFLTDNHTLFRTSNKPTEKTILDYSNDIKVYKISDNVKAITKDESALTYVDYLTVDGNIHIYSPKTDEYIDYTKVYERIFGDSITEFILTNTVYFKDETNKTYRSYMTYRNDSTDMSKDYLINTSDNTIHYEYTETTEPYIFNYNREVNEDILKEGEVVLRFMAVKNFEITTTNQDVYLQRYYGNEYYPHISISTLLNEDNTKIKDAIFLNNTSNINGDSTTNILILTEENELYLSNTFILNTGNPEITFEKIDISLNPQTSTILINNAASYTNSASVLLGNGEIIYVYYDHYEEQVAFSHLKPSIITRTITTTD